MESRVSINPVNSDSSKQTVVTSKGHRRLRKYKKCKPKVKSVGRMPPEQFEILKAAEESEHEIIARLVGKVTRKRPR